MEKKSYTKVTPGIYDCVKKLLAAGSTHAEIAEYLKISTATVGRISMSENIDEYRNTLTAYYYRRKKEAQKKPEDAKPEPPQENEKDIKLPGGTMSQAYVTNRFLKLIEEQNEILKLLSNKLSYIVDQLQ